MLLMMLMVVALVVSLGALRLLFVELQE